MAKGDLYSLTCFFADDTYTYCKNKKEDSYQVVNLLNIYEKASGQKINVKSFSIFFGRNIDQVRRQEICSTLHFQEADENFKYKGLLCILEKIKSVVLGYLKERL